jgi:hypothetical protein
MTEFYIAPPDITWPSKTEKRLPDHQKMLQIWDDSTSKLEKYLTLTKPRTYMFQGDWIAYIPHLKAYAIIRENFVHDWASIPAIFWAITQPDGVMAPFSTFHDFGYRFKGLYLARDTGGIFIFTPMSRKELDIAFREHNSWHNDLKLVHNSAYIALKLFGWPNYGQLDIKQVDWSKPVHSITGT